jgi:hypothetical protein
MAWLPHRMASRVMWTAGFRHRLLKEVCESGSVRGVLDGRSGLGVIVRHNEGCRILGKYVVDILRQ